MKDGLGVNESLMNMSKEFDLLAKYNILNLSNKFKVN